MVSGHDLLSPAMHGRADNWHIASCLKRTQDKSCLPQLNTTPNANAVPQEVALLKGLSYDRNIVQFYGVCPQPGGEPPLLVLEYMAGERE